MGDITIVTSWTENASTTVWNLTENLLVSTALEALFPKFDAGRSTTWQFVEAVGQLLAFVTIVPSLAELTFSPSIESMTVQTMLHSFLFQPNMLAKFRHFQKAILDPSL